MVTCVFETALADGRDSEETWDWRSPEERGVLHMPPPREDREVLHTPPPRGALQTPPPIDRGSLRLE